MRLADVIALTGAKQRTIYSWMRNHPSLDRAETDTPLGLPFPKPVAKEGREVVWDRAAVEAWWIANRDTLGRHVEPSVVMSEVRFINMMQEQTDDIEQDELTGALIPKHSFSSVQRLERVGPGLLKLWFRDVGDAVAFKLRWAS